VTTARVAGLFAAGSSDDTPPQRLPIEHLHDNPFQPRQVLDPAGIAELASVIKTQGFQGTLVARPHPTTRGAYELAFGHRRREAARQAGLTTLPVSVQQLTNEDMITLAITENIQRSDLTPLEEGDTYRLMIEQLGYTQEQIAQEIGKDRGYVVNRLRAARAPDDVRALVAAKPDTLRAVAYLVKIVDPIRRAELISQLQTGMLTGDDLPNFLVGTRAGPHPAVPAPAAPPEEAPPPPATVPDSGVSPRVANSRLRGMLRTLAAYQASLAYREAISMREFVTLTEIKRLVDDLYERCSPQSIDA
jgi:ParB family chromosome partitioning protein